MNNLMNGLIKIFGFTGGLTSLIYSFYLKRTKKLSYVEEQTLKDEYKDQFIKVRALSFFMYFIILLSLFIILTYTKFNTTWVWIIHGILILCVFIYRAIQEGKCYK